MPETKIKKPRSKSVIPAMLPVKKWVTISEACSYLNMSINKFNETVSKYKLRVSAIGTTRYYMVSQLDNILE